MENPVRTCGLGLKGIKMCVWRRLYSVGTCDFRGDITSLSAKANWEFVKVNSPHESGWDSPRVMWFVLYVAHTFLTLSVSRWNPLYLNIPENFLIPQSTECSPHRSVVFQPHFHANVRFSGCHIARSAERASCAISVGFSRTGFDASGRFLWEIINHPKFILKELSAYQTRLAS